MRYSAFSASRVRAAASQTTSRWRPPSTSPCVSNRCSTTAYGTPPDPACLIRRYADSTGNVTVYLAHMQDRFGVTGIPEVLTLPVEPPTTLAGTSVSTGDIQSALNRYRNGQ